MDYVYPAMWWGVAKQSIDLEGKLKVLLVTEKYNPTAKHKNRDDVTHEVTGKGYTAGGVVVNNNKLSQLSDGSVVLKADAVTWEKVTVTARGAILYHSSGGGAKYDELICYCDMGEDHSSTNGPFSIEWDKEGIFVLPAPTLK